MTRNETTFVEVTNGQLAYEKGGTGPNVLFLHGWPLHRATWRNVAANLPEASCYLLDLPGCGESQTDQGAAVSMPGHVDATVEFIKRLGLDDVVLVGNDSGGLIARMVATKVPGHVAGLVLIGTEIPGQHPKLIDQLQQMMKLPGAAAVTRRALRSPSIARNKRMLGGCFWDRDLIEGSFRTEVLEPTLADPAALERQIEILASYSHQLVDELEAAHAAIECPSLLIWGENDPFFPVPLARTMVDQFAGPTRFETVPEARLLVHEEHPEKVAALTSSFLQECQLKA